MEEIIERRREGSKTFSLENGRKRLEAFPGPVHYKDNYDNPKEPWKDIDLTWEDNKITKAPYILVHDENLITVTNKKTGAVHSLELIEKSKLIWERTRSRARARLEGEVIEVIPGRAFVRFRRSIKSPDHPLISRFRIEGDPKKVRFLASSPHGRLTVEAEIKDGILTETIKPSKKPLQFPVRIDPTIDEYSIEASTDDVFWTDFPDSDYQRDFLHVGAGHGVFLPPDYIPTPLAYCGCGLRFIDIDIEKDSIIHAAYLTFRASASRSGLVRTDILVEKDADPDTYPDNLGDFQARRANTPMEGTLTAWDFDTAWVKGLDYDSKDFAWQVQYNIELDDWVALNALSIFWDDKRHRTNPFSIFRVAYSWDAANPI
jgi:hypothetical protein